LQNDTHCNICGNKLDEFDLQGEYMIHTKIGYGSIYDGDEVCLNMCSQCFDQVIKKCEISPLIHIE
jgi:hypothetical protein